MLPAVPVACQVVVFIPPAVASGACRVTGGGICPTGGALQKSSEYLLSTCSLVVRTYCPLYVQNLQ